MECCICKVLPRSKPIHLCTKNGCSPVCNSCFVKTNKLCPSCRDPGMQPNAYAGRLADKLLSVTIVTCIYSIAGCTVELIGKDIIEHERQCEFRDINCIGIHRGYLVSVASCKQHVPIKHLMAHVKANKCAHFMIPSRTPKGTVTYVTNITSINADSIYTLTSNRHWGPMLLTNSFVEEHLVYITVSRRLEKFWLITPWTCSLKDQASKIKLIIIVSGQKTTDPKHIYEGPPNIHGELKTLWDHPKPHSLILHDKSVQNLETKVGDETTYFKVSILLSLQQNPILNLNDQDKETKELKPTSEDPTPSCSRKEIKRTRKNP